MKDGIVFNDTMMLDLQIRFSFLVLLFKNDIHQFTLQSLRL